MTKKKKVPNLETRSAMGEAESIVARRRLDDDQPSIEALMGAMSRLSPKGRPPKTGRSGGHLTRKPKIPQTPQSKAGAKSLFSTTPEKLGRAAVKGTKKTRKQTEADQQADQEDDLRLAEERRLALRDGRSRMHSPEEVTQAVAAHEDYQAGRTTGVEGLDRAIATKGVERARLKASMSDYMRREVTDEELELALREAAASSARGPGPKIPIGKAVRVVKEVLAYVFQGGWGEGLGVLTPGTLWFQTHEQDEIIYCLAGPRTSARTDFWRSGCSLHNSKRDCFEELVDRAIGKAVRVKENIQADIGCGGWGDGPGWLPASAQIWLLREHLGRIVYLDGPRPPITGEERGGGAFPVWALKLVEDLE